MSAEEKEAMLSYINERIEANKSHVEKYGQQDYYDGANQALKDLAVAFELVENYDYFKQF